MGFETLCMLTAALPASLSSVLPAALPSASSSTLPGMLPATLTLGETFSHYGPLGVLIAIGLLFGFGNLLLTHIIGPSRKGDTKGIVYESGMNPITSAHRRFNVRFYMVAMTFLIFDVEIVFLYPWAVTFPSLGGTEGDPLTPLFLWRMVFFIVTSVIAFAYAWQKGVFRYD